ncbi:MAG: hypothetical protein O3A10_11675 [Chloroflexi bacterium]|nr:hypothetical protein [Chloroflexota bacterium]MDA1147178.1 hypothetical protein [Chloroflexota bacterium]
MAEPRDVAIDWPDLLNEGDQPMLWFGAWLVGDAGVEGDWFHSGRGAASTAHRVPSGATGIRLRRWPNEGLAPEYADLIPVPAGPVDAAEASFEREQPFSLLPAHVH